MAGEMFYRDLEGILTKSCCKFGRTKLGYLLGGEIGKDRNCIFGRRVL